MVRSKEVPKKPKDPLLTPPSRPRGVFRDDGFGGSLPWNRGGAAMSPPPASVPNYMRATSSSGAKAGQRAGVPSSASPTRRKPVRVVTRGKVLFPNVPGMGRATCSSTMKEAKFPGALDLAPGSTDAKGPAALRVCPYTYCSLNGHAHAPAVPLRSFLASRRRLIKTQQSMKHKGVSAFRRATGHQRPEDKSGAGVCGGVAKVAPLVDEEALGDFFVEVYAGPRVSSDMSCSDMSLDETVRRMEFVVFDRCGGDEDSEKGGDLGVRGDGEGQGRPEERLGVCRDSSSECSDAGISGNLVEELPWMTYQGYECDSLDDDVSEEQGVIHEEIGEEEVSEGQEGKDEEGTSGGLGDEREEEAEEEQEPKDEGSISDLPCETGIIAEEEGVHCRVKACAEGEGRDEGNILDAMYQLEASIGQERQHPGDEGEIISDVASKAEITAEQEGTICTVEVCKELEERDEDNIVNKVCQGDTSDGQGTTEEKLSDGFCKSEIPECEVVEMVVNILEDSWKEENSADREAQDDETTVESTGKSEVTEERDMKDEENMWDDQSGMEISETVSNVACKEDFFEEDITSDALSEGENSDFSAIGSPDAEIPKQSTKGVFEQDVNTVDDKFEQRDIPAENAVDSTKDIQKGSEIITTCNLEDASEESCIDQESSQDINSVYADASAEMEPESTKCKSGDSTEEAGIARESSQSDNSAHVKHGAQIEPGFTTCKLESASEGSGIAQGTVDDDNSAYLIEGAQMQLGIGTSELEDTFEVSGIGHEIGENDHSYVSDDAQNDSGITTCKFEAASKEPVIVQEADHDYNSADASGGAQSESELTPCKSEDASEEFDFTQEAIQDGRAADVNDGAQKESEIITYESEHAHEESDITQEGDENDCTAGVYAGALKESEIITCESEDACEEVCINEEAIQDGRAADVNDGAQKESEIITCESEHAHEESDITQEGDEDDCTAGVYAGALKESEIITCESEDACEEVCINEEANLSSIVQITEHNYDFFATNGHGARQNVPAEDTDTKEFSIDDMCNVFSEMNLKGDVYLDPTESAICPRNRLIIARRRTLEEEEYMRGFNPRAPNFLPVELDPDAEKVDLKHQMMEDRKNAEEWMIDYALRRAVNNLGPARKKKVELLVQAFETVLPHDEEGKKNITPTRPVQACN